MSYNYWYVVPCAMLDQWNGLQAYVAFNMGLKSITRLAGALLCLQVNINALLDV